MACYPWSGGGGGYPWSAKKEKGKSVGGFLGNLAGESVDGESNKQSCNQRFHGAQCAERPWRGDFASRSAASLARAI